MGSVHEHLFSGDSNISYASQQLLSHFLMVLYPSMTNSLRTSSLLFATVIGFVTPGISVGQESPLSAREMFAHSCSTISLSSGESLVLDCAPGVDLQGGGYQWISMDTGALSYLDDLTIATPRFGAPTEILEVQRLTYHRLQIDAVGKEIARTTVQVLVHPTRVRHDCEVREDTQFDRGDKLERV